MRYNDHVPKRSRDHQWLELLEGRTLLSGSLPGVPDVVGQFAALETHAEGLAFTLPEASGAPDASLFNHYQGLVRYPGQGTPVFYITQKDDRGGYIEVVRMGSRGTDGERLRSNLQVVNVDTANTSPPSADTWVKSFHLNRSITIDGQRLRGYVHPGGMAIEDNILFVAMDTPNTLGYGGVGAIVLFDLGANGVNRLNPVPIQVLSLNHAIDNVGVVKENGRYLLWTNGDSGNQVNVYRTNGGDLRANSLALQLVQKWTPTAANLSGSTWPTGAGAHQSSTFIRQSTSATPDYNTPLYMIGMRQSGTPLYGDDWADLYRVTYNGAGLKLTFVRSYNPTLRYSFAGDLGNFAAASGAYVSPTGELILYSAPHDDEDRFSVDNVRFAELRHKNVVRSNNPMLLPRASILPPPAVLEGASVTLSGSGTPALAPWVELFDDRNFGDRSIMVDYADRAKFELNDFERLDGFGDKTSSVRWRLPVGMSVELFEDDNFRGTKRTLVGNGQVQQIADLTSFSDDTSSMRFVGSNAAAVLTYTWDLDSDGIFGETGTAAGRGNETGQRPVFRTGTLDAPSSPRIVLRVTDGTGKSATTGTTIIIRNKPPTVTLTGRTTGLRGQTLSWNLSASDPSTADVLAKVGYSVIFGDGTSASYRPSAASPNSNMTITHAYKNNGVYTLTVRATDKDGGTSPAATLTVYVGTAIPAA